MESYRKKSYSQVSSKRTFFLFLENIKKINISLLPFLERTPCIRIQSVKKALTIATIAVDEKRRAG